MPSFQRNKKLEIFRFEATNISRNLTIEFMPEIARERRKGVFHLQPDQVAILELGKTRDILRLNHKALAMSQNMPSYADIIGDLQFAIPDNERILPCLEEDQYLLKIIESDQYR
jgi:hypothetical protein